MANVTRNFTEGRMNKVVDERLIPNGEYIDALNIRMGSTENSEIGVIENTKGNLPLTQLQYNGTPLSSSAKCIGALEDGTNETIYWFVHDPNFAPSPTGKLDLICSYNTKTNILTYHIISVNDGDGENTTLNFNDKYLITGVNIIENLLFFTDDYNPPRRINVKKNYNNPIIVSSVLTDDFSADSILVIKRPPTEAPSIQPFDTSGQENFLDDKFICFAYRYRYEDGEYSATSQWSEPAFFPKQFEFSTESFLNEGMTNTFNAVKVSYNSGDSLVVGIDLLFKEANNSIIKVIEKLDKSTLGLADNTVYTYDFVNSKIFTILPESEILRSYDSVPLLAKSQTIMGNRLMYGNYVEGYDMIDEFGEPVNFEYSVDLVSEEIGITEIATSTDDGIYTINGTQDIPGSVLYVDLSGVSLTEGSVINIDFTLSHESFSGDEPEPTETTDNVQLTFNYYLQNSYNSVYELATSDEFQLAIGTASNIETVANSCNGNTLTDALNCAIPTNLDALIKTASGISAEGQGINIITSPSSSLIGLQFNAMKFVDDIDTPTQTVYEYYQVTFSDASFQDLSDSKSLHSNRDYEIGIVYMDDFGRSSTAMVSPDNTVHVPCGYSAYKNSIQVTIPATQRPPYWATKYKFVAKSDKGLYDTIYTNLFFEDPDTNEVWFFLEGENARKVEVGDRYIVKADTSGPLQNCAYATVLAKESQAEDFITPIEDVKVPAGVYMKINPNSFSVVSDPDAVFAPGSKTATAAKGGNYAKLNYPMNKYRGAGFDPLNPTWEYEDLSVPAGSLIRFDLNFHRLGTGSACEERGYLLEKDLVSLSSYDNLEEWFNGENIAGILDTGFSRDGVTSLEYIPTNGILNTYSFDICYLQFYRNPTTNQLTLQMTTGKSCTGINYPIRRSYRVTADIELFRALNTIIFETEAQDSLPDVFFENNLSLPIINGNHVGNIQNQEVGLGIPAIVDTEFFNCFSFGNGAESCKIRDSITGDYFELGNRVTSTSAQDYRRVDRFADITYSGIYNTESNVNKLNEFNSGLLNYKNLEVSFGAIEILYARETDILVLQEDKISYVLAGKNLLSDAAAGGAITSVPEVLGTQIARMEEYGISKNPESFASWGYDKYFTDAKRGAVIQLRGSAYSNEQLKVVSELGMRTWFRDLFNESFGTQKIGGYDPYMNEYVLSSNDIAIPIPDECEECGITKTINLSTLSPVEFCVDFGQIVGEVDVNYTIPEGAEGVTIDLVYDGNTYSTGVVTESGVLTFDKNSNTILEGTITISTLSDVSISITIGCPQPQEITVISVCVTSNSDAGQFIHNEFRYQDGSYTSPLQSTGIAFSGESGSLPISQYTEITGPQGFGSIPTDGATVIMYCNKIGYDNFVFDPESDSFKYLRTDTLYTDDAASISLLLAAATEATPINETGAPNVYSANFVMPLTGNYLYLIYDYRNSVSATLCYSNSSSLDSCCGCPA